MPTSTNVTNVVARGVLLIALSVSLNACGTYGGEKVFVVDAEDIQRGSAMGASFTVRGSVGYDRIWNAAMAAMSNAATTATCNSLSATARM